MNRNVAYKRPSSIDEAYEMLEAGWPATQLVGGGTDVVMHTRPGVSVLIDLAGVPLNSVTSDDQEIQLGSMVTLTEMLEDDAVATAGLGAMGAMLGRVGSPLLRNIATLGGHLARGRLSDIVTLLLVLDASLTMRVPGATVTMSLGDMYTSPHRDGPHLITNICVPHGVGAAGFVKFDRTAFDLALINCAVWVAIEDEKVTKARVAVGETPWLAKLFAEPAEALIGNPLEDTNVNRAALLAAEVVPTGTDQRATADYRTRLVEVAVRRALHQARSRWLAR